MRDIFPEYNIPTKEEFKEMWDNGLFVFDTNVLLDMYRYSKDTRESYLKVLQQLKDEEKLWIPYHVGKEFYKARIDVILEYTESYSKIVSIIDKAKQDIKTNYKNHPIINLETIDGNLDKIIQYIQKAEKKHPNWLKEDEILPQINKIFENCIGSPFSKAEIDEIEREGEQRYEKAIPPGFCDDNKTENKFGDLIVWKSLIKKTKGNERAVIFITGEKKEDWWLEKRGKTIMPRPELRREMIEKADCQFYLYTSDRFLELIEQDDNKDFTKIKKETIEEVKKIQLQEKTPKRDIVEMEEPSFYTSELHHFLFELNQRLSELPEFKNLTTREIEKFLRYKSLFRSIKNRFIHNKLTKVEIKDLFYSLREFKLFIYEIQRRYIKEPEIQEELKHLYSLLNTGCDLSEEILSENNYYFSSQRRSIRY